MTRLTTSRVSVARKRATRSIGGTHLQEEPTPRQNPHAPSPSANSAAGSEPAGTASLPGVTSRCQSASRKHGRQKFMSTGSTVCTAADATVILPLLWNSICGYCCSKCTATSVWEPCCHRRADWIRCVNSRSSATTDSRLHRSPTTASTRQRPQTIAFSADCKTAQSMRSRLEWQGDLPAQTFLASLRESGLDSIMIDGAASGERLQHFGSMAALWWNLSHTGQLGGTNCATGRRSNDCRQQHRGSAKGSGQQLSCQRSRVQNATSNRSSCR